MPETIHFTPGEDGRLYPQADDVTLDDGTRIIVHPYDGGGDPERARATIFRHRARYQHGFPHLADDQEVLDIPCGAWPHPLEPDKEPSQKELPRIRYTGMDVDRIVINYNRHKFGGPNAQFEVGDLTNLSLPEAKFDRVFCVEGFEHIFRRYQRKALEGIRHALRMGGIALVTSPENPDGVSGRSSHNKHHFCELTEKDFRRVLGQVFGRKNVELVTTEPTLLTTNVRTRMMLATCHKR